MHGTVPRLRDVLAPGNVATAGRTWLWLPLGVVCVPLLLFFLTDGGGDRRPVEPGEPAGQDPPASARALIRSDAPAARTVATPRAPTAGEPDAAEATDAAAPRPAEGIPAPLPEPDTATLVVRVTDERGRPVPFASLELRYGTDAITPASTGADGRYETRLPAGMLAVTAWSAGGTGGPERTWLAAGAREELRIFLNPARTVSGVVVDALDGSPVAGARVSFWTFAETDRVTTAADGTFVHPRFPGHDEAHQVRIEADGYGSSVRYLEFPTPERWSLPPAHEGQAGTTGLGTPWLELDLAPELVVSGRVVDPSGRPLAGTEVRAEGYFRILPGVASCDEAVARTDREGAFRLGGLRSDIGHAVLVTGEGYATHTIELAADGTTEHRLGTIALRADRALTGVVLDPDGEPVPDIAVELRPEGETLASGPETNGPLDVAVRVEGRLREVRTDDQGQFVFEGLAPASYRVTVARDRGALADTVVHTSDVALQEGLVLRLPASTLTLEGEVRDEHGVVAGAAIELRRFGFVCRIAADENGRFRVAGLDDAGTYEILASAPCPRTGFSRTGSTDVWGYGRADLHLAASGNGR